MQSCPHIGRENVYIIVLLSSSFLEASTDKLVELQSLFTLMLGVELIEYDFCEAGSINKTL